MQTIQALDFEEVCSINSYIQKRMQNSGISKIISMERPNISQAVYTLLQHAQPTTASVERDFSMLQKLFAKGRNLKVENVKQFII